MDVYSFRENETTNISTPRKRKRISCLMRDEIAISNSTCNDFMREMSFMKLKYPFLTESQIKGRTMDKFGIPNMMGRPYKIKSGSVNYSTVNHILYLIKRSITERKSSHKNSGRRRHTISGTYVPIEIKISRCEQQKKIKSRKNLEKKFSLYSEENETSDDDYNIEFSESSEYSRGRVSDVFTEAEYGSILQADVDEVLKFNFSNNTYEKKSHTIVEINSVDRCNKGNENIEELRMQREDDDFKICENSNEEVNYVSDSYSLDSSNTTKHLIEEESIVSQDKSEGGANNCNHLLITKKPTKASKITQEHSAVVSRSNSDRGDNAFQENFGELKNNINEESDELQIIHKNITEKKVVEIKKDIGCKGIKYLLKQKIYDTKKVSVSQSINLQTKPLNESGSNSEIGYSNLRKCIDELDDETNELQIIYEKVTNVAFKIKKKENLNGREHAKEQEKLSETPSVIESSQNIANIHIRTPKYLKQSISVSSREYVWKNGSQPMFEKHCTKKESLSSIKHFQRSELQKISKPFMKVSNNLENNKIRRGYCQKMSESIILLDLESYTECKQNTSIDELSTNSGRDSEENRSIIHQNHENSPENFDDSLSDTNFTNDGSQMSDDSLKDYSKIDLNVAFSPHFANGKVSGKFSDEDLSSEESDASEVNFQISEKSATNENDSEGYYLANLFDDENTSTCQRTLRSTSGRKKHSEPSFVDE